MNSQFFTNACRPWSGKNQKKKVEKPSHYKCGGDSQEEIDYCLNCTLPPRYCNTCCGPKQAEKEKANWGTEPINIPASPCLECYTKQICQANGWTCNAKARWEEKHG